MWSITTDPITDLGIIDDALLARLRAALDGPDASAVIAAVDEAINSRIAEHGLNDDGSWAGDWDAADLIESILDCRDVILAVDTIAADPEVHRMTSAGAWGLTLGIGGTAVRFIGTGEDGEDEDWGVHHPTGPAADAVSVLIDAARIGDVHVIDSRIHICGGYRRGEHHYPMVRLMLTETAASA